MLLDSFSDTTLNVNRDFGEAITTKINSDGRAHMLKTFVTELEANSKTANSISDAIRYFNKLKTNGNLLAHCQFGGANDNSITAFHITARGRIRKESFALKVEYIHEVYDDTYALKLCILKILHHLRYGKSLLDKYPQSRDLLTLLRQDQGQ